MKFKNKKGITLVALVITIIVLLVLAGISIAVLTGKNGLISKAQEAKIRAKLADTKQEVSLEISSLVAENIGDTNKITPKMIADQVNTDNDRHTYAENENTFPTNIVYPKQDTGIGEEIQIKIGTNLEIVEIKTASGITDSNNNSGTNNSGSSNVGENVNVGNVNIKITDVTSVAFTINVEPENKDNIAMYQYYVNGNLVYEGIEQQYRVNKLNMNTNYEVEVKVIPKTTVSIGKINQKTLEEPVIELANKFDKYIYIDSNNGNDTSGNGSNQSPYATLDKIADSGIIENGYSYGIVLRDGTYNLTTKIFKLTCNKSINIIGNREKTTLVVNGIYSNSGGGSTNYSINLYRVVWDGNSYNNNNIINPNTDMNFYAVVFTNIVTDGWTSYFIPSSMTINNCTMPTQVSAMLRTTQGSIKLTNCYGGFTSGYSTSDSSWNYQTNYITSTPQVNTSTYRITDSESVWKDVGTGTDSDGTQADLGVYGGTYSWEYETDI